MCAQTARIKSGWRVDLRRERNVRKLLSIPWRILYLFVSQQNMLNYSFPFFNWWSCLIVKATISFCCLLVCFVCFIFYFFGLLYFEGKWSTTQQVVSVACGPEKHHLIQFYPPKKSFLSMSPRVLQDFFCYYYNLKDSKYAPFHGNSLILQSPSQPSLFLYILGKKISLFPLNTICLIYEQHIE